MRERLDDGQRPATQEGRDHRYPSLIGVGLPRTGTRYLATMITEPKRASHDFDLARQALVATAHLRGTAKRTAVRHYLTMRMQAIRADADICGQNLETMDVWPEVAPHATFVLTIRDPLEWVDAIARALLTVIPQAEVLRMVHEARCRPDLWPTLTGDEPLRAQGLYSLDAYLRWWATATKAALEDLPAQRLVVLPTAQLPTAAARLSAATGWPVEAFTGTSVERNAAAPWESGRSIIDDMPQSHVAAALERQLVGTDWSRLGEVASRRTRQLLGLEKLRSGDTQARGIWDG